VLIYFPLSHGQVFKALDCIPRGPGSGPTGNRDFLIQVHLALNQKLELQRRGNYLCVL